MHGRVCGVRGERSAGDAVLRQKEQKQEKGAHGFHGNGDSVVRGSAGRTFRRAVLQRGQEQATGQLYPTDGSGLFAQLLRFAGQRQRFGRSACQTPCGVNRGSATVDTLRRVERRKSRRQQSCRFRRRKGRSNESDEVCGTARRLRTLSCRTDAGRRTVDRRGAHNSRQTPRNGGGAEIRAQNHG